MPLGADTKIPPRVPAYPVCRPPAWPPAPFGARRAPHRMGDPTRPPSVPSRRTRATPLARRRASVGSP